MKTVGITTCYVDNFGACLQAYALQKIIESLNYKCEIIKYTPVSYVQKKSINEKIYILARDIYHIIKRPKSIRDIKKRRYFNNFRNKMLTFGETNYPTIESLYENPPEYDAYVTGSDQLWNPVIHNMSNNKAYFLDFAPEGKKRIAYAPSIGLSVLPDQFKKEMSELLNKMSRISVREKAGKDIVSSLTDKPCEVVLDPTLLHDKTFWNKTAVDYKHSRPYIFCYLFGRMDYINNFVEYAKLKTGYDVVIVPFTEHQLASGHKKIIALGPREFLGLIKNASLVLTDSFHATAFSINFNVPFYSLLRNTDSETNNMNSRIFNMLDIAGLTDRLVSSENEFPEDVLKTPDFENTNKRIRTKRVEDIGYLKNALES